MVALVILIVLAVVVLAAVIRLVWSVARGGLQIEPTSYGRQLFGRSDKKRKPE